MADYRDKTIHHLLEITIEKRVLIPSDPQIVGALGAALYGHGKLPEFQKSLFKSKLINPESA